MSSYFNSQIPVTYDEQCAFAIDAGKTNAEFALDNGDGLEDPIGAYWDNYCDTMVEYGITRENGAWEKGAQVFEQMTGSNVPAPTYPAKPVMPVIRSNDDAEQFIAWVLDNHRDEILGTPIVVDGQVTITSTCGRCFGTGRVAWGRCFKCDGAKTHTQYWTSINFARKLKRQITEAWKNDCRALDYERELEVQRQRNGGLTDHELEEKREADRKARNEQLRKDAAAKRQHVGTIGEKIEFTGWVTMIRDIDGNYGISRMIKFEADGNLLTTFSTGKAAWDMHEGDKVTIVATVKDHVEFRGAKETRISRIKLVSKTTPSMPVDDESHMSSDYRELKRTRDEHEAMLAKAEDSNWMDMNEDGTLPQEV